MGVVSFYSFQVKNIEIPKILEMLLPGVENVPMSQETVFKLSRGPLRPYIEKSVKISNLLILHYFPIVEPPPLLSAKQGSYRIGDDGIHELNTSTFLSKLEILCRCRPPAIQVEKKYSLEYGENSLSIQKNSLNNFNSYAIVDDLLATGGTVNCVAEMLRLQKKY